MISLFHKRAPYSYNFKGCKFALEASFFYFPPTASGYFLHRKEAEFLKRSDFYRRTRKYFSRAIPLWNSMLISILSLLLRYFVNFPDSFILSLCIVYFSFFLTKNIFYSYFHSIFHTENSGCTILRIAPKGQVWYNTRAWYNR